MLVSCQISFLYCSLVSRHVIKIGFKKSGTELRTVVGLHQILAGNVINNMLGTTTKLSMPF